MTYQHKRAESQRIERETREYLARGGKIRRVASSEYRRVYFQRNERSLVMSLKPKDCEIAV